MGVKRREKGEKLNLKRVKMGICSMTSFYRATRQCGFEGWEKAGVLFGGTGMNIAIAKQKYLFCQLGEMDVFG